MFTATIGALTAFVAASIAIGQYDIKKVLAYSTVSQLGFMVAAAGMGANVPAMFHLLTHGVFKALLFLAAGSVISRHTRASGYAGDGWPAPGDAANIYCLYGGNPRARRAFFPLLVSGRRMRLLLSLVHQSRYRCPVDYLRNADGFLYGSARSSSSSGASSAIRSYHPHESESIMTIPLMILAVGALLVGFINFPWFNLDGLGRFLEPVFAGEVPNPSNPVLAIITLLLSLGALYVAYLVYARHTWRKTFKDPLQPWLGVFFEGFETAWGSDTYTRAFIRPFRALANFLGPSGRSAGY